VVEEISRELPALSNFVTLSPVPNFAEWLRRERMADASVALRPEDRALLAVLDREDWWQHPAMVEKVRDPLVRAAAFYFMHARTPRGAALDSVARFHLGNGARLERINFLADTSIRALRQSHGLMVNYQYDLGEIEKNHEAYAEHRTVVASSAVSKLARPAPLELVPVGGK
jgi:malonyl-CoA decarboxylase